MSSNNGSNDSLDDAFENYTVENCYEPQIFSSAADFFNCYAVLFGQNFTGNVITIILFILTVIFNVMVIIILLYGKNRITIFDKILIGRCVVDGLTGLINEPLIHINLIFNFWPFDYVPTVLFSLFDYGLNTVSSVHMLYMTWVLLRSIQAGGTFEQELLMRRPVLVMALIWLLSTAQFIPFLLVYGLEDYSINIEFPPFVEFALNIVTWFSPLLGVAILGFYIVYILNERRMAKLKLKRINQTRLRAILATNVNSTNIGSSNIGYSDSAGYSSSPTTFQYHFRRALRLLRSAINWEVQTRFQIVIISYWIQWLPFCITSIIQPVCECVPGLLANVLDWFTYSVSLTDPLIALLVNSHVILFRKRNTRTSPNQALNHTGNQTGNNQNGTQQK